MERTAGQARGIFGSNAKRLVLQEYVTAGQGNGIADDVVKGRARASRGVCQTAEECGW